MQEVESQMRVYQHKTFTATALVVARSALPLVQPRRRLQMPQKQKRRRQWQRAGDV